MEQHNEQIHTFLTTLITHMGFRDVSCVCHEESRRFSIFINDASFLHRLLPSFITDIDYVTRMYAKKNNLQFVFIDINNYRKDREEIIIKLAKATARKALATKTEFALPAMNAYERRLVHAELATHPDLKTESFGEGHSRHIVIRPL